MTLTEKQAWASLGIGLLIVAYLCANMLAGWNIPDQSARALWRTYFAVIGAAVLAEIIIGVLAGRARAAGALEDERDVQISAKADRIGMWVAVAGINVLIWHLLWHATLPDAIVRGPDLTHTPTLFFLLMASLWLGHLTRQIATIVLGRR